LAGPVTTTTAALSGLAAALSWFLPGATTAALSGFLATATTAATLSGLLAAATATLLAHTNLRGFAARCLQFCGQRAIEQKQHPG
jgi:hypothetical protein